MTEAEYLIEAVNAARMVQNFLWGEANDAWGLEEWRRMFRKRVAKIEEIKLDNPHWKVELKKRLLQTAALAVALLATLDKKELDESSSKIPSNLPQYRKVVEA